MLYLTAFESMTLGSLESGAAIVVEIQTRETQGVGRACYKHNHWTRWQQNTASTTVPCETRAAGARRSAKSSPGSYFVKHRTAQTIPVLVSSIRLPQVTSRASFIEELD